MTDVTVYPFKDGPVTVLGPECIMQGEVISYQGENYYTEEAAAAKRAEDQCAATGHVWEILEEVGHGPTEVMCTRCTTARRVLSLDDSRKYSELRHAAADLRLACQETGNPVVPTQVAEAIKRVCDLGTS